MECPNSGFIKDEYVNRRIGEKAVGGRTIVCNESENSPTERWDEDGVSSTDALSSKVKGGMYSYDCQVTYRRGFFVFNVWFV